MMPTPTVGRIVHYRSHGTPVREDGSQAFTAQCRAAIVTEVDAADANLVGLMVCNPTGLFFHSLADGGSGYDGTVTEVGGAPTGRQQRGGSWHWPEGSPAAAPPQLDQGDQAEEQQERGAGKPEQVDGGFVHDPSPPGQLR